MFLYTICVLYVDYVNTLYMYALHCIVVARWGGQTLSAVGDKQAKSQTDGLHILHICKSQLEGKFFTKKPG